MFLAVHKEGGHVKGLTLQFAHIHQVKIAPWYDWVIQNCAKM